MRNIPEPLTCPRCGTALDEGFCHECDRQNMEWLASRNRMDPDDDHDERLFAEDVTVTADPRIDGLEPIGQQEGGES